MRVHARSAILGTAALATILAFPAPGRASDALGSGIERLLQPLVERGDFSGCAGIRLRRGEAVVRCAGLADIASAKPNTPETRFLIGSLSKQFTAAAILRLEEMGRLSVGDPLSRFVPGFPRGDAITLEHLLAHTSGLPDLYGLPDFERLSRVATSPGEWVARLAEQPLLFEPGEEFAYSNSGYVTLAHVVEAVSGSSYGEFLRREILLPLGLSGTGDAWPEIPEPRATGYDPLGARGVTPAPFRHPTDSTGAGTLYSTIGDLLRWGPALVGGEVLGEAATDAMLTRHAGGYGYGIGVFRRQGRPMAGHDGRLPGFVAGLDVFLDEGTAIAFVANVQSGLADALREDLTALAVGTTPQSAVPEAPAVVLRTAEQLAPYPGRYRFSPALVVEVRLDGDRLMARANNSSFTELAPLGGARFFSRATWATASFETGSDGAIARMHWSVGGSSFPGERIDPSTP